MTRLLNSLVQIAMLRKDPGILPASFPLASLLALAYAGASAFHAFAKGVDHIVARAALDVGLSFAFFWGLLGLTRRGHRFVQTISAVFGSQVLLAPLVALLIYAARAGKSNETLLLFTNVASALVVIWLLLIVAHILRRALDTGLVTGYAAALAWVLATRAISIRLFSAAA